jgi:hypothetical protein
MDAFQEFSGQLAGHVAGKIGDEGQRRLSALVAARTVMPDTDVYDRIRLARYILTGSEEPPEVTEIRNAVGEVVVAHVEERQGYDAIRREPRESASFPFPSGDMLVLGPEVFASTPDGPQRDTVINWAGVNFVPQDSTIFSMTQEDRERAEQQAMTGVVGPDPEFEAALAAEETPVDTTREPAPSAGKRWAGRRGGSTPD